MVTSKQSSEMMAAVDLGSNSFHLKIARAYEGELLVMDRMREMVQLGAGLTPEGELTQTAQSRALACLEKFGERLRALPRRSVRAVGTNVFRRATKSLAFIDAAEKALGFPIQIISGEEEARLVYLGVAHTLPENALRRLVIDIGGGSTELIIGEYARPTALQSVELGCVSHSRTFFEDGQISAKRWQRAVTHARDILLTVNASMRNARWRQVIGASGTIRAIHSAARAAKWCTDGITRPSLEQLAQFLMDASHVDELKSLDINESRLAVLPGGLAILFALFDVFEIDEMRVSDGALREGLLFDMLGWTPDEDTCELSVTALANRFHIDKPQAARVIHSARQLYQNVAQEWDIDMPYAERWLAWAAQLHEIGLHVASSQHHKHGAYIVENADLAGFTAFEQRLLGLLVRSQRGKFPWSAIKDLPDGYARPLMRLALLLRLAILWHRGRADDTPIALRIVTAKNGFQIEVSRKILSTRPLLRADLLAEMTLLTDAGLRAELLEE